MTKFLHMAIRNIFRNKRRLIITTLSILVGVVVSLILSGFITAIQAELEMTVTRTQIGDLKVFTKEYVESLDSFPLNYTLNEKSDVVKVLEESDYVESISPRVAYSGIFSVGASSITFVSIAVDPDKELKVCPRAIDNLKEGEYLSNDDINKVLISEQLAESMDLKLGDRVIMLAKTKSGVLNTAHVKIGGIFSTMIMGEKLLVYSNINMARKLLSLGDDATEIAVKLHNPATINKATNELKDNFAARNHAVELLNWKEIMVFFKNVIKIQDVFNVIISVILFILVTTVIVNTILMTVYERTKEIGMMKALGMKLKHILQLFMIEGSMYGLTGGILGTLIATLIMLIIKLTGGIEYSFAVEFGANKPWLLFPTVSFSTIVRIIIFAIISGVAASFYPALKAARMKIVDVITERALYN